MSRKTSFTSQAWDDYLWWQGQDRKTLKKINGLIKTAQRDPVAGAEPLSGDLSGCYSRHINKKDVLVYEYDEYSITVLQCRFHYKDK